MAKRQGPTKWEIQVGQVSGGNPRPPGGGKGATVLHGPSLLIEIEF